MLIEFSCIRIVWRLWQWGRGYRASISSYTEERSPKILTQCSISLKNKENPQEIPARLVCRYSRLAQTAAGYLHAPHIRYHHSHVVFLIKRWRHWQSSICTRHKESRTTGGGQHWQLSCCLLFLHPRTVKLAPCDRSGLRLTQDCGIFSLWRKFVGLDYSAAFSKNCHSLFCI